MDALELLANSPATLLQTRQSVKGLLLAKKKAERKSLPGAELFHVELRKAYKRSGLKVPEIARRLATDESTVFRWMKGKLDPTGAETCFMMLWFGLRPEDLVRLPSGQYAPESKLAGLPASQDQLEAVVRELVRKELANATGAPPAVEEVSVTANQAIGAASPEVLANLADEQKKHQRKARKRKRPPRRQTG